MNTRMKTILGALLALCVSVVFCGSAMAAETPVDLMPADDSGYTVMAGDGTVTVADDTLVIVNNGDGDLRVTIDTKTAFDLAKLHTLHMNFKSEMPFKMAWHIKSTDGTNGWANTSDNFADLFTISNDRAAKGDYDVKMDLNTPIAAIVDRSEVQFEQFIILLTGKGTFTLNTVEMTDGTASTGDTTKADSSTTAAPTTTAAKTTAKAGTDNAKTGDVSNALLFTAVAAVAAGVVTVSVTASKKHTAR